MNKTLLALGISASLFAASVMAGKPDAPDTSKLPPAATRQGVTFAKDIKPIFEQSCVKCHGAEKHKGKLRLDTLAASLKGGESGECIVPGHSDKSSLVWAVARIGDEDDAMPPKSKTGKTTVLSAEQVGLIRAWIDQGAK